MDLYDKLNNLIEYLKNKKSIAVAFSGGVDSGFLLRVAKDAIDDKVVAITAVSSFFPQKEIEEAKQFTKQIGVEHILIDADKLLLNETFVNNGPDRCYHCKKFIFTKVLGAASSKNIVTVADGTNIDDVGDYRPGLKALLELGIVSPLREVGIGKQDVRELSKFLGLPFWDKPAIACLATRIPYGTRIRSDILKIIDLAEQFLHEKGIKQVRVRFHDEVARIEVMPWDMSRFIESSFCEEVYYYFTSILGFKYVCLDIKGYRTGSMNEALAEHSVYSLERGKKDNG